MREISSPKLNARVCIDEQDRVRQINHSEKPWTSTQDSPLRAAIDYLQQMAGELGIPIGELRNADQAVTFSEPRQQDAEYRLGEQKGMFDSSTIIFNQTYLNVPVWRAAITLTLKQNPNRVVLATDTSERGMNATLPAPERIDEHRKLFALAAADRKLRELGLSDQRRAAGLAEDDEQPKTAAFVRRMLGRDASAARARDAAPDEARAIRGRFFVYRYDASQRFPKVANVGQRREAENDEIAETPETSDHESPVLPLAEVDASIANGDWRLVSEVTFSFTTSEHGRLNWRALVDVQTDSVLLLEPLAAGLNGLVFHRDPITSTGDASNTPDRGNNVLNPLRSSVQLPNLRAPVNGTQELRGRFAVVTDLEHPPVAPPTKPANTDFNYNVRTNDFAAVNAYYHTDRFFALVESLGFPIATYFNNTTFPVPVDHRDGNTINAHCVGNGSGGIGHAGYALNDLSDTTNPIGRACDSRVHLHELGGHGILYEHVDHANFGFAHSAGDSLSAILHAPDSLAPDPFRYAPWNPQNTRRFDRAVGQGWAWGGAQDDRGYQSEEILCTTMFRVYRSIGGDSADLGQRRFASRMMMYLILRAISTLTPATNPRNALGFANALIAVDQLNWTSEGVFGGAYGKVIRWSFEKQGLYQPQGTTGPVTTEGEPPEVDVYIDDGRGGTYEHVTEFWNNPSVWNRRAPDGGTAHQEPTPGATNHVYVKVKNRGTRMAQNVRVRGFHHRPAGGTIWPDDFQPLTTTELVAGTLAPRSGETKIVGPFAWIPNADATQQDGLLMVASATGDPSNVDNFTASETIPEWRLVPNDNNLGMRTVVMAGDDEAETGARAAGRGAYRADAPRAAEAADAARWGMRRHAAIATAAMERLQSDAARQAILRIFNESGEASLGDAAQWADKLRGRNRPHDPATERFLGDRRNRGYSMWHYVNLPLDLDGYDRERHPEFTRDDDVVQIILRCVEALRNPGTGARFEEIIALRWLSHLVGDVHQPVHVGCGYIADARTAQARLVSSPDEAIGLPSDKGGGELLLPVGVSLHTFWDSRLGPDVIPDALDAESDDALIGALAKAAAPQAHAEDAAIPERVVSWANASLAAAREAYQSLRITGYQPDDDGDYPVEWEGEDAYRQRCAPIVSDRMAAAAANLAGLLDELWT